MSTNIIVSPISGSTNFISITYTARNEDSSTRYAHIFFRKGKGYTNSGMIQSAYRIDTEAVGRNSTDVITISQTGLLPDTDYSILGILTTTSSFSSTQVDRDSIRVFRTSATVTAPPPPPPPVSITPSNVDPGYSGTGGGGAGGTAAGRDYAAGGGGGVGLFGEGPSGKSYYERFGTRYGAKATGRQGQGGSGGSGGNIASPAGALYGGGGGGADPDDDGDVLAGDGAQGAVRLIWGMHRKFPKSNTKRIPPWPPRKTAQTILAYTTPGTYTYTVPSGVTVISALAVGGGGGANTGNVNTYFASAAGGGGALAYTNSLTVAEGDVLTITVGAAGTSVTSTRLDSNLVGGIGGVSKISRSSTDLLVANGGGGGRTGYTQDAITFQGGAGGTASGTALTAGFSGGKGGDSISPGEDDNVRYGGAGGGGAAGYLGAGGAGGVTSASGTSGANATTNSGGGGGGASGTAERNAGGGGGGVGLFGVGTTGVGGTNGAGGQGGSGGLSGGFTLGGNNNGGLYGGGAGAGPDTGARQKNTATGANGAVVLVPGISGVWPTGTAIKGATVQFI
jgi:hypothetical protein